MRFFPKISVVLFAVPL